MKNSLFYATIVVVAQLLFNSMAAYAFAGAYGIYLLCQFFLNIPRELEDAARIDGGSRFRIYWQIILPLAKSALVTMGVFTFIGQWSDSTWPLVVLSDAKKYPITVGLSLFRDQNYLYWDRTFAACLLATLPLRNAY